MENSQSYKTVEGFKMLRRGLGLSVSPVTPPLLSLLMLEALVSDNKKENQDCMSMMQAL